MSSRKLVLVAEDCRDIATLEAELVMRSAAHPVVVADGEAALSALREIPFALALLDLDLPRLTGSAILEAMAADSTMGQIPVIVVSGEIDGFQRTQQVIAVYSKPFSVDKLIGTIQNALNPNRAP